jgi:hypothetical protein
MPASQRTSGKPDRFWALAAGGGAVLAGLLLGTWRMLVPTPKNPAPAAPSVHAAVQPSDAPASEPAHVHTPRSARPEGSTRPPTDNNHGDPELIAATESVKSANARRDPHENVPEPREVATMLDSIIARLEKEVAAAQVAKDAALVSRLQIRLARLRRDRERQLAQADGGPPAAPSAEPGVSGEPRP